MNATTLKIIARHREDYEGTWNKSEVEDEIRNITGNEPEDGEWVEWVLEHDIEPEDIDQSIIDAMKLPNTCSISYMSKTSGFIEIMKK